MSILQVRNLRREFSSLVAVDDVSFAIEPGQVVGLIGPNGAGKTTLLRMLATLLPPTDGTATINGADLRKQPLEIRHHVGYLPDFFNLYSDLTLHECLDFFARAYHVCASDIESRIDTALAYVSLEHKRNSFIRHLSRGMVQRMGLATLLVRDPQLFLLDEPASGLDPIARIELRDVLKRLARDGKTILISSHILMELSGFCTHIAIMNAGQLVVFDAVDAIERQIAGQSLIVRVLGDQTHAETVLRRIESVTVTGVEDHTFTLACLPEAEVAAEINRRLVSEGVAVAELVRRKTSLEDLFVTLSVQKNLHAS